MDCGLVAFVAPLGFGALFDQWSRFTLDFESSSLESLHSLLRSLGPLPVREKQRELLHRIKC